MNFDILNLATIILIVTTFFNIAIFGNTLWRLVKLKSVNKKNKYQNKFTALLGQYLRYADNADIDVDNDFQKLLLENLIFLSNNTDYDKIVVGILASDFIHEKLEIENKTTMTDEELEKIIQKPDVQQFFLNYSRTYNEMMVDYWPTLNELNQEVKLHSKFEHLKEKMRNEEFELQKQNAHKPETRKSIGIKEIFSILTPIHNFRIRS